MKRLFKYEIFDLIAGACLIILGILSITYPGRAIKDVVILYGFVSLTLGVLEIVSYVKVSNFIGFAPTTALTSGILGILTGIILIANPNIGQIALTILFPVVFLSRCIAAITKLCIQKPFINKALYYFNLIINIIGIFISVYMFFNPLLSYYYLNIIISGYLVIIGIEKIVLYFN